jgi:hypothetical protein
MANRNFWLTLFTGDSWEAFNADGARQLELGGAAAEKAAQVRPGDYLLCCLMGVSRFIGVLSVTSDANMRADQNRCRIKIKPLILLTPETALPAYELRDRLSCFHTSVHPHAWMTYFTTNLGRWKPADGEHVVSALLKLRQHAVRRPLSPARIANRPQALAADAGLMTIPAYHDETGTCSHRLDKPPVPVGNHALVQAFFIKLGNKLGFKTWIPDYDRLRRIGGNELGKWPGVKTHLELPLEEAARQTLSQMDVLWIDRGDLPGAFAIERDGLFLMELLRIADFLALKPDCRTAFYLVAPDTRRTDIIREINRPVFTAMKTPPASVCRFISLSTLHREIPRLKRQLKYLTNAYLLEISESCEPQTD